jgi:hypothetical protein
MAKWTSDEVADAALDYLATATKEVVCSAQPTTYAEAVTTYMLAEVVIDGSDFTQANGDTSGRKTTVAQQSAVSITNSGTATHVATVITASSALIDVTTCTSQALTSGGSVTIPAWDHEISDPT